MERSKLVDRYPNRGAGWMRRDLRIYRPWQGKRNAGEKSSEMTCGRADHCREGERERGTDRARENGGFAEKQVEWSFCVKKIGGGKNKNFYISISLEEMQIAILWCEITSLCFYTYLRGKTEFRHTVKSMRKLLPDKFSLCFILSKKYGNFAFFIFIYLLRCP